MNYLFVLFIYNLYGWKITQTCNSAFRIDSVLANRMWYGGLYWSKVENGTKSTPLSLHLYNGKN